MITSMGAVMAILGTVFLSSVTLQRSFAWSANYSAASTTQLRVLDTILRDYRRASVVWDGSPTWIYLEVPDTYSAYDGNGNPTGAMVDPIIHNGRPQYGDPALPVWVCYWISGSDLFRYQYISTTGQWNGTLLASQVRAISRMDTAMSSVSKVSVTFAAAARPGRPPAPDVVVSATAGTRPLASPR